MLTTENKSVAIDPIEEAYNLLPSIAHMVERKVKAHGLVLANSYVNKALVFLPIKKEMKSLGWEFVGSGFFSIAFAKGDLVIKLGLKAEDGGALYAAWSRANQGLPGVPTIHRMTRSTGCYAVLMERYYSLEEYGDDSAWSEYGAASAALHGEPHHPLPVAETAEAIRTFFLGVANFDLHNDNVMLDKAGNLIIIDPVSFSGAADACGQNDN